MTASQMLNKREVCEYLKKSKRSVETYVRDGRLPVSYIKGKNGNTAVFDREAVKLFKRELEESWRTGPVFQKPRLVGFLDPARRQAQVVTEDRPADPADLRPVVPNGGFEALTAHLAKLTTFYPRPVALGRWVPLEEAAKLSGFPKTYLLTQARLGAAWAVNAAAAGKRAIWRFRVDEGGTIGRSS